MTHQSNKEKKKTRIKYHT